MGCGVIPVLRVAQGEEKRGSAMPDWTFREAEVRLSEHRELRQVCWGW
jgi:hypothetical protein